MCWQRHKIAYWCSGVPHTGLPPGTNSPIVPAIRYLDQRCFQNENEFPTEYLHLEYLSILDRMAFRLASVMTDNAAFRCNLFQVADTYACKLDLTVRETFYKAVKVLNFLQ